MTNPPLPPEPSDDPAGPFVDPDRTVAGDLSDQIDADTESKRTMPQAEDAALTAAEWPKVPGYQILAVLGRGGMGVVYKARQVGLGRHVALKMILGGAHAAPEDMVRFLAEGEAVAQLQHTNIVQIYQVGRHGELPFFSLEYVDGGSLAQRLDGTPQPPRVAAQLIECLARAMHLAHQKGIVHRDLKPGNILLASAGRKPPDSCQNEESGSSRPPLADCIPKITDFGLAKRVEAGAGLTQTGAILGTPSYMAPEQAEARKDVGPATDIYALGAILYEMLTGRPPFRAPTPLETVLQVLSNEPVPPTRLQPSCPPDLDTICLKCLHKEPTRRYASVEALAEDLQRFCTDRPILARRTSSLERLRRWCRRNPAVAGMTATVALLLVLLATGSLVAALWLHQARQSAEGNLGRAVQAEEDTQEQLFFSLVDQARAGRFSRRVGQRSKSLEAIAQAVRIARERNMPPERFDLLRNEAVACLALPDVLSREREGWPDDSVGLDFTAVKGLYARTDRRGNVFVYRFADDEEVARLGGEGVAVKPYFSTNGNMLFLHEQDAPHRIKAWRIAEPAARIVLTDTAPTDRVAISPDGDRLAVSSRDGTVRVFLLREERLSVLKGAPVDQLRFSPEGRWLGIGRRDGEATFYDPIALRQVGTRLPGPINHLAFQPAGGTVVALHCGEYPSRPCHMVHLYDLASQRMRQVLDHADCVSSLVWRADGKRLVAGTIDGSRLHFWDPVSGQRLALLNHKGGALRLAASSSGDLIASQATWAGGVRLFHGGDGRELLRSPGWLFEELRPAPDGRLLQVKPEGQKLRFVEVLPGHEFRTLVPPDESPTDSVIHSLAVHPNERLLATGTHEALLLWDLTTGFQVARLEVGPTEGLFFDRDGTLYTSGPSRVLSWPVRIDPSQPTRIRMGPARAVPGGHLGAVHLSGSPDGRILVLAKGLAFPRGSLLLRREAPNQPTWLGPQYDVRFSSVTSDGRLAATASWFPDPHSPDSFVKVWDTASGKLEAALPIKRNAKPEFTPDGHRLGVNSGPKFHLFETGSWRETFSREGQGGPFTPDSRSFFLEGSDAVHRLCETATARELAAFDNPLQLRSGGRGSFSPGGRYYLFGSTDLPGVHVWDLHAVRRGLAAMGLDWSSDTLPAEDSGPPTPLQISVEGPLPDAAADRRESVVLLPHAGKPATAQEIAAWVRQLSHPDSKKQEEAVEALAAAGGEALKALTWAMARDPRKQSRDVVNRLAVQEALTPNRVRLRLKQATLDGALRAFSGQTGLAVKYLPSSTRERPRPIDLVLDDVPVWEALDRICSAAGVHLQPLQPQGLTVTHQAPKAPPAHGYVGPFRLQSDGATYRRRLGASGANEDLHVELLLLREPQARALTVSSLRLTEARTDDDRSLLLPGASGLRQGDLQIGGIPWINLGVPLRAVDRRGGKLKLLKGVLALDVAVRRQTRVVVPDLARAQGRTFFGSNGYRVTVVQTQQLRGNQWNIHLHAAGPAAWRYESRRCGFELVDARNRSVVLLNSLYGPYALQSPQPEDLAWLGAVPLASSLSVLPWPAFAVQSRRPAGIQWQGTLWGNRGEKLQAPVRLRMFDCETLRTEVPFELRDVPLP